MKMMIAVLFITGGISMAAAQDASLQAKLDSLQISIQELQKEVHQLKAKEEQAEIEKIREAARRKAESAGSQQEGEEHKVFKEGSRSLQALNPEISVTGDMLTRYLVENPHFTDEMRSGFLMRVVGIHIQSNLDPFSMAKSTIEFGPDGVGVGEAYVTWVNVLRGLSLTAGRFRQQFGVLNRWHEHALDQAAFPLPIELYMGEEGLAQTGVSVGWLMPKLTASANELTLQITNSSNDRLFGGERYSLPASLVHFKNYYDLNRDTYLEWGVTGLAGTNDHHGFSLTRDHRWTYMGGLDLTLSWSPVNRVLYRGITWRSELFYLNQQVIGGGRINAIGGYSYLDWRVSERWIVGIRGDFAQPPTTENNDQFLWQAVPYLTFWQSEFVYLRFQFNHLQGYHLPDNDNRFTLQLDWAIGPHKHERY